MSHIVTITTEIRDVAAIRAACQRLELPEPVFGAAKLFSGSKTGWQVQLSDWKYPIVCDVASGRVDFDNFNGRWGDTVHFARFRQRYAVEKARIEGRRRGHTCTEQALANGSIKLTVNLAGSV